MKSIQIDRFGGPEVLVIKDVEIAKPGPKEVLIKNLSIGLNFIDVYHRTGLYPIPLPSGIGLESCGVVEEIGSEVKLFKIGDRVTHASMPIGAYSEKQIMPEEKLVSVPDGISDEVASCITLKGITAEYLLHRAYQLKKGESFEYGQFKSAKIFKETSTPIAKVIKRAKRIIHFATRKGSKVIIVTARQDMDDKKLFKEAFKAQGIDIGRVYVERAGNIGKKTASANKVVIFKKYLDTERYARIRLFDDDKNNLKAFLSLEEEYPKVDFTGYQVFKSGNIKKL